MLTIDEIAERAGGIAALATMLGIHWSTVCGYKRTRLQRLPAHHARRVNKELKIPLYQIRPDIWPPPVRKETPHDLVTA